MLLKLAGGFRLREGCEGHLAVNKTHTERLQRIPDAGLPVDQGSVGVEGQYGKVTETHGAFSESYGVGSSFSTYKHVIGLNLDEKKRYLRIHAAAGSLKSLSTA